MIHLTAVLSVDFGNSETRGSVRFASDDQGTTVDSKFTLSNWFSKIPDNYTPPEDYTSEDSTVIRFLEGDLKGTYANGDLCDKEFARSSSRPTALEKKYSNIYTPLSFSLAVLKATEIIAKAWGVTDLRDLDITWTVVALLPPSDVEIGKDLVPEVLKSVGVVEYLLPKLTLNIKVANVHVHPEGFCAFVGAVFESGMSVRQGYENLLTETVLVMDIGAGTTDLMLVSKGRVIDNSKNTIATGGNQVLQLVKKHLRDVLSLDLPESLISEGLKTGIVKDGTQEVNIVSVVETAERQVADRLVVATKDYFEEIQFPLRTISALLACGGGSMSRSSAVPLSDMLVDFLKHLAPNIALVPSPKVVDEFGNGVFISPRELNINGASILAELV